MIHIYTSTQWFTCSSRSIINTAVHCHSQRLHIYTSTQWFTFTQTHSDSHVAAVASTLPFTVTAGGFTSIQAHNDSHLHKHTAIHMSTQYFRCVHNASHLHKYTMIHITHIHNVCQSSQLQMVKDRWCSLAGKVTARLAESNVSLPLGS